MTRLGISSDIHDNLPALEMVLSALEAGGVDRIICLGDVAVFGPQPLACVQRLRAADHSFTGNKKGPLGKSGPVRSRVAGRRLEVHRHDDVEELIAADRLDDAGLG